MTSPRKPARHSAIRFDFALAKKEGLLASFLGRCFSFTPQLRHQVVKARDKSFDLARFMGGA